MRVVVLLMTCLLGSQSAFANSYVASCLLNKNFGADGATADFALPYQPGGAGAGTYSGSQQIVFEQQPFEVSVTIFEGEGNPSIWADLERKSAGGGPSAWHAETQMSLGVLRDVNLQILSDEPDTTASSGSSNYALYCSVTRKN